MLGGLLGGVDAGVSTGGDDWLSGTSGLGVWEGLTTS